MFAFYCSPETRLILLPGRLRIFCDGVVASFLVGLAMSGWSLAESEEGSVASSWGIAASPSEPQPSSSCSAACASPKGPSLAAALTSFFGESWPPPHELASTSGPPRDRSRSPLDPVLIRSCSAGPSARWKLLSAPSALADPPCTQEPVPVPIVVGTETWAPICVQGAQHLRDRLGAQTLPFQIEDPLAGTFAQGFLAKAA
jgi:hypothetical protein